MPRIPVRLVVFLLIVACCTVEYMARVNINVAIISMVRPANVSAKVHDVCPIPMSKVELLASKNASNVLAGHGERFDWSPRTQGIILGAYFYPYVLMQFPSGRMAEVFGAKWIICVGLAASAIVNLLTPALASSVVLLAMSRIFLGFCQAGVFPACFAMICRWFPQKERSVAFGFIDVGANLGAILAAPMTGALSEHVGWPSSFYVSGAIATLMFFVFCSLATSKPEQNRFVSEKELAIIRDDEVLVEGNSKPPLPIVAILTSKAVLVMIVARLALGWTYLLIQTKLPAYLNDVLHVSPTKNGLLNAMLYITANVTLASFGYIAETIVRRGWMSRTNARKAIIVTSRAGMMTCLLLIPLAGCSIGLVVALLVIAMMFYGMSAGGDIPLPSELTSNFPASLMSIMNTLSASSGFIAPFFVGTVLEAHEDNVGRAWNIIFVTSAAICFVSGITFLLFGTAERQPWDSPKKRRSTTSEP